MPEYRNAGDAFVTELREIREAGDLVQVRGSSTQERRSRLLTLQRPLERCIVLPRRHNDIFAIAAETVWVLAGRNDLAFLRAYLPRADDFSDDGTTWRAGYGPRLRAWHGVDQIGQSLSILRRDGSSRQAVISLFDPALDFVVSRDIPCTNWLHFLLRDGRLDLHIAMRSNDIWWGLSAINLFEWSVLLEMMAHWLDADVGQLHYFASSLHLYDRHFDRAEQVLRAPAVDSPYDSRRIPAPFTTAWDELDDRLSQWFVLEQAFRSGSDPRTEALGFPDPLLRQFLLAVRVKWLYRAQPLDSTALRSAIDDLGDTDVAFAVRAQLDRSIERRANGG